LKEGLPNHTPVVSVKVDLGGIYLEIEKLVMMI
jgi:hypothetical protein